ncbi:MAG: hypothetical protein DCC58_12585 [Chloroflexi bacterium]|nr:MAG: hypothetical protein DCC58_12585 [Chloroflexota bacterium]
MAVVADLQHQPVAGLAGRDTRFRRAAVAGDVGERFRDDKVGGRFDRFRQALRQVDIDDDRDGSTAGQRGYRRVEPAIGQHRRVDAARQVADLLHGALGLLVRLNDQRFGGVWVGVQLFTRHAEVHRELHQALLRSVVQVALDALQLTHRDIAGARAALSELPNPCLQLALAVGAEQVAS